MKRLLFSILCFAFLFVPIVHAEEIRNFDSTIQVNKDGTIDISERIDYDFGEVDRHGILRDIPFVKTNADGKKFQMDMTRFSVVDTLGKAYRFDKRQDNGVIHLKIGDPGRTISGLHTYIISYHVGGALTYFSDHDELYWNITGNGWNVPIDATKADVVLPETIDPSQIKVACYTGTTGSTDQNCNETTEKNHVFLTAKSFGSEEGLTAVVGIPKGIVAELEPKPYVTFWETPLGRLVGAVLIGVVSIAVILWYIILPLLIPYRWWRNGRDPEVATKTITAWFSPPKGKHLRDLTPGEVGTLVDEKADLADISSTIVDLARRGYLKIVEKTKGDVSLKKDKDWFTDADLQTHERTLLDGIFGASDEVKLKDTDISMTVENTKKKLYDAVVNEGFFTKSPDTTRTIYTILGVFGASTANIPLFFSALVFGRNMPKKTTLGREQANIALSLKNFLTTQERQLEFQAKNQMFFEKLLPYAVAFGVEKIWADRFRGIEMKPPTWYQGYDSTHSFNSAVFVHNLNSSMGSFRSAATPTRSSSGFSSGFSGGGGSSGGGGGGGGGGSW